MRTLPAMVAAAAAIVLALPAGSPASPRVLYEVALKGTVQTRLVSVESLPAPEGCSTGDATSVRRFAASARLRSLTRPVPIGPHSSLAFRARLLDARASASVATSGHWETKFGEADPLGICSFVPRSRELPCSLPPTALERPGALFYLWIEYRGREISYGGGKRLTRCEGMGEASEAATLMPGAVESGGYRVNLSRRAFDRLRVGECITGAGKTTHRWGDGELLSGSDTLTYRITVRRVR